MAISLVGSVTTFGSSGNVTSFTQDVPTGVADGDLLLWDCAGTTATAITGAPTGWSLWAAGTTTALNRSIFYRWAASEPSSYTTSGATLVNIRWAGTMTAYRGVDQITPRDVADASSVGTTTTPFPAVTPVTADAWVVAFGAQEFGSALPTGTASSSNMTVDGQAVSTAGINSNALSCPAHFAWTSGPFTPNMSNTEATVRTIGTRIVLRPAGAGAVGVTTGSIGTPTSVTGSATAPAPMFGNMVAAGQKAIMFVNLKPFDATVTTPTNWSLVDDDTNGSTASGGNTGSTKYVVFELTAECAGTESGTTVTLAVTSADSAGAVIHTYNRAGTSWAASVCVPGSKVGNSADMAATSSTQTDVLANDLFVTGYAINASLGTPSADTLTQTGVTFGTVTNQSDVAITTGNDTRNRVDAARVASVTTPSGGATAGYTNASSTSGTVAFVRLRDVAGAPALPPILVMSPRRP